MIEETTETQTDTDRLDKHPRFLEVNDQKRRYKREAEETATQLAALKAEVEPLRASASRAAELEAKLAATETRWQEEAGLMRVGLLDDDAREIARLLWGRQPEADRKPLTETVAAWAAAPDAAPVALRGYLAPPASSPSAPAGQRPTHGAQPATPTAKPTAEEYKSANAAFARHPTPENKKRVQDLVARGRAPG